MLSSVLSSGFIDAQMYLGHTNKNVLLPLCFFRDGEEWLHFRRILNKIMLKTESLQWIMEPCEQVASTIVERWKQFIDKKEKAIIPNLEGELYRFSIDSK